MNFLVKEQDKLAVYSERRKGKTFVGVLSRDREKGTFEFEYDADYLRSKTAIPLGPELSLKRQKHRSRDELFAFFSDRIPSKANPAYEEYCRAEGISPKEKDPFILLTTIGKRGPSSFVFEDVQVLDALALQREFTAFRNQLKLSLREIALVLDLNFMTINKLEKGMLKDRQILRYLAIFLSFPDAALWQVELSQAHLHHDAHKRLVAYFSKMSDANSGRILPKLERNGQNSTAPKRSKGSEPGSR